VKAIDTKINWDSNTDSFEHIDPDTLYLLPRT